jgi:hypothetical protein
MTTGVKKWAGKAKIGEVRKRKAGEFKKVAKGKWVKLKGKEEKPKGEVKGWAKTVTDPHGTKATLRAVKEFKSLEDDLTKPGMEDIAKKALLGWNALGHRSGAEKLLAKGWKPRVVDIEKLDEAKERISDLQMTKSLGEEAATKLLDNGLILTRTKPPKRKWRKPPKQVAGEYDRHESFAAWKKEKDAREALRWFVEKMKEKYPDGPESAPEELRKKNEELVKAKDDAYTEAYTWDRLGKEEGKGVTSYRSSGDERKEIAKVAKTWTPEDLQDRVREIDSVFTEVHRPEDPKSQRWLKWKHPDELDVADKAILEAVAHFTHGNVPTVRNPEKFNPELGSLRPLMGPRFRSGYRTEYSQSQESYGAANEIMKKLAKAPAKLNAPVYRGIALPRQAAEQLKVGQTFESHGVESYSMEFGMASRFARNVAAQKSGPSERYDEIVFNMAKPKRGTDITSVSRYDHEAEFITGGPMKITNIKKADAGPGWRGPDVYYVDVEQIDEGGQG